MEQTFDVDPPGPSGTYHGDLAFGAGAEKSTVSLTLLTRDFIAWPVFVIAIGTWFAYRVKRFLGLRRITLDLREQEANMGDGFRRAQAKFTALTASRAYGAYDIAQDIDEKRRDVLSNLDKLDRSRVSVLDTNSQDYKDAVAGLQALTSAISAWNAFGGEVDMLARNLDVVASSVDGAAMEPPRIAPPPPDFYQAARALLDGKPIAIAELTDLRTQLADANSLTRMWPGAYKQAAALTEDYRSVRDNPENTPDQAKQLPDLLKRLVTLWDHLQRVKKPADLEGITKFDGELDAARDAVDQVMALPRPRRFDLLGESLPIFQTLHRPQIGGRGRGLLFDSLDDGGDSSFTVASPLSDAKRAELARAAIQRGDLGSAVFSGVIALLTGLSTYYIGKSFGTAGDYVTLFLWAAGTKAALDILAAALDKMTRSSSPASEPPSQPPKLQLLT